ncbi:MAG: succinate dehydrogenase, hydrophobic membrane anchor protein [Rhodospirillaceae bacterium]|nr:succinate dehydrogenase, hydrophobic membrane anchor protein [Rhodospirillaceae bacterium]|tara:strand:- start:38157 stop:38537 length:381 start_codon:yes stop_codon:yes gene_type:complete
MSFRAEIGRVFGLAFSKSSVAHWWVQRLTAVALVPMVLWFVASIAQLAGANIELVREWMSNPVTTVLLILLIVMVFHHAQLGLQVVIEDYVHTEWVKTASITAVKIMATILGLSSLIAVLKIALSG